MRTKLREVKRLPTVTWFTKAKWELELMHSRAVLMLSGPTHEPLGIERSSPLAPTTFKPSSNSSMFSLAPGWK